MTDAERELCERFARITEAFRNSADLARLALRLDAELAAVTAERDALAVAVMDYRDKRTNGTLGIEAIHASFARMCDTLATWESANG